MARILFGSWVFRLHIYSSQNVDISSSTKLRNTFRVVENPSSSSSSIFLKHIPYALTRRAAIHLIRRLSPGFTVASLLLNLNSLRYCKVASMQLDIPFGIQNWVSKSGCKYTGRSARKNFSKHFETVSKFQRLFCLNWRLIPSSSSFCTLLNTAFCHRTFMVATDSMWSSQSNLSILVLAGILIWPIKKHNLIYFNLRKQIVE